MSTRIQLPLKPDVMPARPPAAPFATLQRKRSCGGSGDSGGECGECKKKKLDLQRRAIPGAKPASVPPRVYEVLHSPGEPLDRMARTLLEPRLGHDFSRVRVHNDAKAAESAAGVGALAYTVGRDIVFASGQYRPEAVEGRRLLAHELAHVTQQGDVKISPSQKLQIGPAHDHHEHEADRIADRVVLPGPIASRDYRFFKSTPELKSSPVSGEAASAARDGGVTSTAPRLHQLGADEEESADSSGDSALRQSGTCQNGGAASDCDAATGTFGLLHNDNTCCTKDCTAQHEAVHATDVNGWGCCKAYSTAYNAKGADKAALTTRYANWVGSIRAITECHAYTNDVTCADALARSKDCSGAGKNTDCCKDIVEYKARYSALATTNCAAAPKKAPPCPAF